MNKGISGLDRVDFSSPLGSSSSQISGSIPLLRSRYQFSQSSGSVRIVVLIDWEAIIARIGIGGGSEVYSYGSVFCNKCKSGFRREPGS